jgi:hypothetical protein
MKMLLSHNQQIPYPISYFKNNALVTPQRQQSVKNNEGLANERIIKKHRNWSHEQSQSAMCVLILQLSAVNQVAQGHECIFGKAFTRAVV